MRIELVFASLVAAVAIDAAAATKAQSPAPATATAVATGAIGPPEFARPFIQVPKDVGPSVVAVTSVSTAKAQAPETNPFDFLSPFGDSPLERFFKSLPRQDQRQQRQPQLRGIGSGVIVDAKGLILTNNHVVRDAETLSVVLDDAREYKAEVIGKDPKTDLAVIRLKPNGKPLPPLRPAVLGDSSALEVGQWVMAFGSPFGLKRTVSAGIVSAKGRGHVGISDYEDFIQTDAAINPGNSGGPLVDLEGRVVGINTAIVSKSGGYQGVGFAIPINMAKAVMSELIAHGTVTRGFLGVLISELSDDLAASFGFTGKGVLVQDVTPDGPGAKAGLKPGDIITERDGRPISDVGLFRNSIADTAPGTTVNLTVFRGGRTQTIKVKLELLKTEEGPAEKQQPQAAPSGTGGSHGMEFVDVTPELRQHLGLDLTPGVLITRVQPGSDADDAGLAPGDLLVQVGTTEVKTAQEAERALERLDPKATVRLRVIREKQGVFVLLKPRGG